MIEVVWENVSLTLIFSVCEKLSDWTMFDKFGKVTLSTKGTSSSEILRALGECSSSEILRVGE